MTKNVRPCGIYSPIPTSMDMNAAVRQWHLIRNAINEEDAGTFACGKKHAGRIINKKEENGRRKNLIFAITGGIFHNGLEERYQEEKSKSILKRKQHSSGLLIRKRQKKYEGVQTGECPEGNLAHSVRILLRVLASL